jgi:nanoRNase/pAp phosphatase (c-di-AMP/oligoRNAs hydrolase)
MMHLAKKPLLIVYHADCIDGAAAAWVIGQAKNEAISYVEYNHDDPVRAEEKVREALGEHTDLIFTDVTPNKKFLEELLADGKIIEILDHHKTAAQQLKDINHPNLTVHLDPDAPSAAKMAWQQFFPEQAPPPVIDIIDQMDGGGHGLNTPEEFAAASYVDAKDIETPEKAMRALHGLAKMTFHEMAKKGHVLTAAQDTEINHLINNAVRVRVQLLSGMTPVDVPIINADIHVCGRQISSRLVELGASAGVGVAFAWSIHQTGAVSLSIRTNGTPDASQIADHFRHTMGVTGGGHKDAAAVHFASLAEFAKHMHLHTASPKPPAPPSLS